jgi:acyl carrier protein
MPDAEIYEKLTRVFREIFDEEHIVLTPATSAADIDGWDSFNHIRLAMAMESAFQVKFTAVELGKMETAGVIVELIQQRLPVQA